MFSPHTAPFVANKVSIYKSSWLKKMHVPAPKKMRELYKKWDVAKEELVDLGLPMVNGHYDVASMKSGKEPYTSKQYKVETFFDHKAKYKSMPKEKPNPIEKKRVSKEKSDELNLQMGAEDQDSG